MLFGFGKRFTARGGVFRHHKQATRVVNYDCLRFRTLFVFMQFETCLLYGTGCVRVGCVCACQAHVCGAYWARFCVDTSPLSEDWFSRCFHGAGRKRVKVFTGTLSRCFHGKVQAAGCFHLPPHYAVNGIGKVYTTYMYMYM